MIKLNICEYYQDCTDAIYNHLKRGNDMGS